MPQHGERKKIKAVKHRDSVRSCLSGVKGHPNRIRLSQLSFGRCHVKMVRRLEQVITNLKLTDLDCEILIQDQRAEIAQMRHGRMKKALTTGERDPGSGRRRPHSEDKRITER